MEEKKPLIYRLETDIKPAGYSIPQMFGDEIKALAALPKSMQDELSRPFPKWVADAMLTDLNSLYPRGVKEIMAGVSAVDYRVSRFNEFQAHYQQVAEAETILGIDHSRPETVVPYNHLPVSYVLQEARQLKAAQEQAAKLTEYGALTLIFRSLDDLSESAQDRLIARLRKKGAIAVNAQSPMPLPDTAGWDALFNWYYSVPRWLCPDLRELSQKVMCAYGTVRNHHSLYVAQYGERPMWSLQNE